MRILFYELVDVLVQALFVILVCVLFPVWAPLWLWYRYQQWRSDKLFEESVRDYFKRESCK